MALTPGPSNTRNFLLANTITVILFNILISSSPSEAVCRFGSAADCIFPCRCKDDKPCDRETGDCPNGCADGKPSGNPWRGPGCQIGNVAFDKQAHQTGMFAQLYARYGIDGQLEGSEYSNQYCAHPTANDINQFALWYVDLGGIYLVNNVTIYNTNDGGGYWRLQKFALRVGMDEDTSLQSVCHEYSTEIPRAGHVTLSCDDKLGRYVSIQRYDGLHRNMFTMCEAVVIGHRYIDTECSKCDGGCSTVIGCTQCKAGRLLPDCRKNCSAGSYGVNCEQSCGHCAENGPCAVDTGICETGCKPWYGFQNCTVPIAIVNMDTLDVPTPTAITSTSVVVSWSTPSGIASGLEGHYRYVIKAFTAGDSAVQETHLAYRVTNDVVEATLLNLRPNTRYNVGVMLEARYNMEIALGKPTASLSVKTDCGAPDKPIIHSISTQKKTLSVAYEVSDSGCDHFTQLTLDYRLTSRGDWTSVSILNGTSPVIIALKPGAYFARIRAVNNGDKVSLSDVGNAELSDGQPKSAGLIAGVVVAVIFFLLVVAIAVFLIVKFKDRLKTNLLGHKQEMLDEVGSTVTMTAVDTPPPVRAKDELSSKDDVSKPSGVTVAVIQPFVQEVEYDNIPALFGPIATCNLAEYMVKNEELKFGFKGLSSGLSVTTMWSEPCRKKNRFDNIKPYKHTMVRLEPDSDAPNSDYINASFITGYPNKPNYYIACQGPTKATVNDMWRMVWQVDASRIVMLTKLLESGRSKCEQYWPDEVDSTVHFGRLAITMTSQCEYADFTMRVFLLENEDVSRSIRHFQFTSWPDKSVPSFPQSVLSLRNLVRSHDDESTGPLIVHCSAGIGRTGTFIALDYLLEQAATEGLVDVSACVNKMRCERMKMVQTDKQYVFLHHALLNGIESASYRYPSSDFIETYQTLRDKKSTEFARQFRRLETSRLKAKNGRNFSGQDEDNMNKNRSTDIIPLDNHRPYLSRSAQHFSDYINATYVNGYKRRNEFIVTQMPLRNTIPDFWQLVFEHKVPLVVMLEAAQTKEEIYWPTKGCSLTFGSLTVVCMDTLSEQNMEVRQITISHASNPSAVCKMKHCAVTKWPKGTVTPNSDLILDVAAATNEFPWKHGMGPIVIQCLDGASRSGLLCAVCHCLNRIAVESDIDMVHTVQLVRRYRTQFIDTIEQYQYLYQVLYDSLCRRPVYENINQSRM